MNRNDAIGLSFSLLLHGALALALVARGPFLSSPAERAVPLTIAMFEAEPERAREPPPPAPGRPMTREALERPRTTPPVPRVEREPAPPPVPEASPVPEPSIAPETTPAPPIPPAETAVREDTDTPPVETASAPVEARADPQAMASYARLLAALIAQHRAYPRLAQLRRMQGMVEVRMRVGPGGRLIEAQISRSSGYEVLDRQALDMVRLVRPLPEPPKPLLDREFTVSVPVAFRLEG